MPHADEARGPAGASSVVGQQRVNAFNPMIEVNCRQQAVWRRPRDVVDPDALAGIIDLTEEETTGFDLGPS